MGASTWLWNQRGDPESLRRVAAGGYRFSLSGAAPAGETEMDCGAMANLREQATGKVLPADRNGKKATEQGTFQMVAAFRRDRGRASAGRVINTEERKCRGGPSVFRAQTTGKLSLTT